MDPFINQTITKILGAGVYELSNGMTVKIIPTTVSSNKTKDTLGGLV